MGRKNNYIINRIEKYLLYERVHSIFQSAKILDHYELEYNNLLLNNSIIKNTYIEETDVFCYYIIRSIFMYDINNFLNFVRENKLYFKFIETEKNINNFIYIIKKVFNNNHFIELIKGLQIFIEKNRKYKKKLEYKTLRMSIFG